MTNLLKDENTMVIVALTDFKDKKEVFTKGHYAPVHHVDGRRFIENGWALDADSDDVVGRPIDTFESATLDVHKSTIGLTKRYR
jgi:hypothetical protein